MKKLCNPIPPFFAGQNLKWFFNILKLASSNHLPNTLSFFSHFSPYKVSTCSPSHYLYYHSKLGAFHSSSHSGAEKMATALTAFSSATVTAATIAGSGKSTQRRTKVNYVSGLSSFGGLKAQNNVVSLGLPVFTEQSFAKFVSSLRQPSRGRGGGALSSTCNVAGEIFRIAGIMPALVLVGVAVGFVLLRLEASLEEAE